MEPSRGGSGPAQRPGPLQRPVPAKRPGGALGTISLACAVAGVGLLAFGLAAGLSAPLVTAIAVGPGAGCQTARLAQLSMSFAARPGSRRRSRGAWPLTVGVFAAGASATAACVVEWLAPTAMLGTVRTATAVALAGLFASAGAYLLGLMCTPGRQVSLLGRLRRTLDGVGMATCGFFVAWMLLFSNDGVRPAGFVGVLLSCGTYCCMVVAGTRATADRSAALACGGGIALSIAGTTQLIVALDYHGSPSRVVASGASLLIAPLLIGRATRALGDAPPAEPLHTPTDFGGYPLFALPLAAALLTWGHHFVERRPFDSTAIGLVLAAIMAVTLRGAVASFDASRYAGRLVAREAYVRSLFAGSSDVILVVGADLVVSWQSPAAARQFGLSDQDVLGKHLISLVHTDDQARLSAAVDAVRSRADGSEPRGAGPGDGPVEVRLRDGFGAWREVECTVTDGRRVPPLGGLVVHLHDVSDRAGLRQALRRMALADRVTGLHNSQALNQALEATAPTATLVVLRLAGLTDLTRARGRSVADTVLAEAARRLRETVHHPDLPARLDGAQFAVLTTARAVQAQFLATRLLTVLAAPYPLPGQPAHLSAAAGLAELATGVDGDEVLRRAELALEHAARRQGGVEWYDTADEAGLRRRLMIEEALPRVLATAGLDLRYQPVVELRTLRPVGVATVPLWRHPALGPVAADEFLPVADRLGLADPIGAWVMDRACHDLASWLRGGAGRWLSVALSDGRLADPALVPAVHALLERHGLPGGCLVVEVSTAAGTPELAEQLTRLRAMGVGVALDARATARATLAGLCLSPVDLVKVDATRPDDGSRPDDGGRRVPRGAALAGAVVRVGAHLGAAVVAQRLRTGADLDAAMAAGCRHGQGNLFCPPVPAERLEAYLEERQVAGTDADA